MFLDNNLRSRDALLVDLHDVADSDDAPEAMIGLEMWAINTNFTIQNSRFCHNLVREHSPYGE